MNNEKEINGWVNYYKPKGMTSAVAVTRVKKQLNAKKAGHAGTLDPLAEGVLPIALGETTKEIHRFMDAEKEYEFTITFGTQMTTDDEEGVAELTSDKRPTLEEVEKILPHFTGSIMQTPPIYSALKIDGVPAYKLARAGKEVKLKPREVIVHSLKIKDSSVPTNQNLNKITLTATVGKGTYIRSLARDIGQQLGCFGYITNLIRTRVGDFTIEEAKKL